MSTRRFSSSLSNSKIQDVAHREHTSYRRAVCINFVRFETIVHPYSYVISFVLIPGIL